ITSTGRIVTLEESASFIEWLSFDWLTPLISVGRKRRLADSDLWDLNSRDRAAVAVQDYTACKKSSLLRSLFLAFRRDLFVQALFALLWSAFQYAPALFVNRLLRFIENPEDPATMRAWLHSAGMSLSAALLGTFLQHAEKSGQQMAVRARAIISHEISQKCLRRNTNAASYSAHRDEGELGSDGWNSAAISNMLTVDVQNISEMFITFPSFIGGPVQIGVALAMLWNVVGIATLAVFGVMLVALFASDYLTRKLSIVYQILLDLTDERLGVTKELLQSIRSVKLFAWEGPFMSQISKVRHREQAVNWRKLKVNAAYSTCTNVGSLFALCACLGVYTVAMRNPLTASVAFTAVALINALRTALWRTPQAVVWVAQARVSCRRINDFLSLPEFGDVPAAGMSTSGINVVVEDDDRIAFESAYFSWDPANSASPYASRERDGDRDASVFSLKDLNVDFLPGKFNVITGPTGSGKTSLLLALLGEMPRMRGNVYLPRYRTLYSDLDTPSSNIAYVAQQPWLQSTSIRDNILFGQPYDEGRYRQVLLECALDQELQTLDVGDRTQVGSKSATFSESLKQRIALARAVYSPARHLLLDDCLSAVDAHTAKHIVEKCLLGPMLLGRTRILVTYRVDLCMNGAVMAVQLRDGRIIAQGSADEVLPAAQVANAKPHEIPGTSAGHALLGTAAEDEKAAQAPAPSAANAVLDELSALSDYGDAANDAGDSAGTDKPLASYLEYMRASGGYGRWLAISFVFTLISVIDSLQMYTLRKWSAEKREDVHDAVYFGIYLAGAVILTFSVYLANYSLCMAAIIASRSLHDRLVERVVGAKPAFFAQTPVSRILSRFGKDVLTIDQDIPSDIATFLAGAGLVLLTQLTISIILPHYLIAVAFLTGIYISTSRRFLSTARELKRLRSTSKSPLLLLNADSLDGVATIRAFGMEHWFSVEHVSRIDAVNRPIYLLAMADQWLACRLQWASAAALMVCCSLIIVFRSTVNAGAAGIVLVFALVFAGALPWVVRDYGRVEHAAQSVKRVQEYIQSEQEPTSDMDSEQPPSNWPQHGQIALNNISIKSATDQGPGVCSVTLDVKPGERIGIVARPGISSSAIYDALFRLTEATTGSILIDGIETSKISPHDMRSRLAGVPQDPVLFSGTIRSNLDPALMREDADLW
ncbi:hypothetical protein THASP1DRAFT_4469, partial [Thamnocephalis sphaerospora]